MKTRVYKNLNKPGYFSIRQKDAKGKWTVVGHATDVSLFNGVPHVGKSHDRVRANKTREVFAWIEGDLEAVGGFESFKGRAVVIDECDSIDAVRDVEEFEEVMFLPFSEVKRGFFWIDGDDLDYAALVTFTNSKMYAYN